MHVSSMINCIHRKVLKGGSKVNSNKLRKSSRDRVISGVCGGIAEFFGISSLAVRILYGALVRKPLVSTRG